MGKNNNNNDSNKKIINSLDDQMLKLKNCLEDIKGCVDSIQNGDGDRSYWNGTNAYNMLKNALAQYDNDKVLLDYVTKCRNSIKK